MTDRKLGEVTYVYSIHDGAAQYVTIDDNIYTSIDTDDLVVSVGDKVEYHFLDDMECEIVRVVI